MGNIKDELEEEIERQKKSSTYKVRIFYKDRININDSGVNISGKAEIRRVKKETLIELIRKNAEKSRKIIIESAE